MAIIDESDVVPDAPGAAPTAPEASTGPREIAETDIVPDASAEPNYKGFWSGMSERLAERGGNVYDVIHGTGDGIKPYEPGPVDPVFEVAGQEVAVVGDLIGETVKRLYHWLPEETQKRIETAGQRILTDNNGHASTLLKAIQGSQEAYTRLSKAYPKETRELEAVLNVASVLGGGKAAKTTGEAVSGFSKPLVREGVNIAKDVSEIAARSLHPDTEKVISSTVKETMQRAVKMSSKNKGDWAAIEKSFAKSNDAIKAIVDNQGVIAYTDEAGKAVGQGLPQTMDQFSQAISQVKQHIFSQYDALATDAERQGMHIDLESTIKKLDDIANDNSILRQRPEVAEYAQKRATDLLVGESRLTPSEAQREISILNDKLKPFYANPGYEGAHKIWIDEMVARDMRASLDKAVTSATGEKYQGLKNLYGSLSAIEPEVSHRAVIFGRQNIKGMPDYISGPITAVHAIKGLMNWNPVEMAAAAGAWASKYQMKQANNADRLVESMFAKVSKAMKRQKPFEPESLTGQRIMEKGTPQRLALPGPTAPNFNMRPSFDTPNATAVGRGPRQLPEPQRKLPAPTWETGAKKTSGVVNKGESINFTALSEREAGDLTRALETPGFQRTAEQKAVIQSSLYKEQDATIARFPDIGERGGMASGANPKGWKPGEWDVDMTSKKKGSDLVPAIMDKNGNVHAGTSSKDFHDNIVDRTPLLTKLLEKNMQTGQNVTEGMTFGFVDSKGVFRNKKETYSWLTSQGGGLRGGIPEAVAVGGVAGVGAGAGLYLGNKK